MKSITKGVLTHHVYKQSLFQEMSVFSEGFRIMNENQGLYKSLVKKLTVNPLNDKKFIVKNDNETFTSLSFGHKDIEISETHSILKPNCK